MKTKILPALKTKYSNLGFSEKAFDGVADFLSKTVTKEEDIETATGGVEGLLKAFQGESDRIRTELQKRTTELEDLKKKIEGNPQPKPETAPQPDEPEWFKEFKKQQAERLNALEDENNKFKAEKAKHERANFIQTKAKELGLPEWRLKGVSIPEELDEQGVITLLTEFKQDIVTAGLGGKTQLGIQGSKDEALNQMADDIVKRYSVEPKGENK